jgi:hypothetical protein
MLKLRGREFFSGILRFVTLEEFYRRVIPSAVKILSDAP